MHRNISKADMYLEYSEFNVHTYVSEIRIKYSIRPHKPQGVPKWRNTLRFD